MLQRAHCFNTPFSPPHVRFNAKAAVYCTFQIALLRGNGADKDTPFFEDLHPADLIDSPISTTFLVMFRIMCFSVIGWTVIDIATDPEPLEINNGTKSILLKHTTRFTTFTLWSWCLQGIYFFLQLLISPLLWREVEICGPQTISEAGFVCRSYFASAWILFEVCFPVSILVTLIVWFVLIPAGKYKGVDVSKFLRLRPLILHNCNSLFMFVEMYMNNLPMVETHFPFVVFYGLLYVVFAWWWYDRTGVFYYFFLDYNRRIAPFG
jgi:hypothetical protein